MKKSIELKVMKLIIGDGRVIENANIGIKDGLIKEVMVTRLKGKYEETIELTNKIVMPGLIDAHCHIRFGPKQDLIEPSDEYQAIRGVENAKKALMAGVTSLVDAGAKRNQTFAVRNAINNGVVLGPRFFVCGDFISMTGGIARKLGEEMFEVTGANEARRAARILLMYYGADFLKLEATGAISYPHTNPRTPQLTVEEMKAVVEEGNKIGKKVHAHVYGEQGITNCIEAGVDVIVHGQSLTDDHIRVMKERDMIFLPTLKTFCNHKKYLNEEAYRNERIFTTGIWEETEPNFRNALKKGVKIAMGTDAGEPGNLFGDNPKDLEYMVDWGMTSNQAIIAGTLNAAKSIAMDNRLGTIELEKHADLLVLNKDPLKDISAIRTSLENVMLNGKFIAR